MTFWCMHICTYICYICYDCSATTQMRITAMILLGLLVRSRDFYKKTTFYWCGNSSITRTRRRIVTDQKLHRRKRLHQSNICISQNDTHHHTNMSTAVWTATQVADIHSMLALLFTQCRFKPAIQPSSTEYASMRVYTQDYLLAYLTELEVRLYYIGMNMLIRKLSMCPSNVTWLPELQF